MLFTTNHDKNSWEGTEFERMGDGAQAFYRVMCYTTGCTFDLQRTGNGLEPGPALLR